MVGPAYRVHANSSGKQNSSKTLFRPDEFEREWPFIIWQDSLEVNPCILIGSFLVGILPYGPFPWKRSQAVKLCIFCFRKPANSNFATKTTKRKRANALIFAKKLPKRLIFYRAYNKREKDEYSRSEFYYPEDLELQRLDQASAKFGRPQDNFIKNQRSANTNKRMATDLNTLLH